MGRPSRGASPAVPASPPKAAAKPSAAPASPSAASASSELGAVDNALAWMASLGEKHASLIKYLALALIFVLAFVTRLFSVLRYEVVIHEFDPYFNYRSTKYLVEQGFYDFVNWFDEYSWYPLGRIVGGAVYPGLMVTSAVMYWVLNAMRIIINVRTICVFTAPFFASLTSIVTYLLGKEAHGTASGLVSAALVSIVPGYISRSVAGSFDNEGIAIFALVLTYYTWVKAVNTGSLFWGAMCALAYFYMAAAWGGYIFIINLIPLHVFVLLITGRYTHRLYVAYTSTYLLGTLLAMQVTFIGFQPVQSSEHMAAMGIFGLLQAYNVIHWLKSMLPQNYAKVQRMFIVIVVALVVVVAFVGFALGYISPFTGRFYSLLDPTYAKEHIPIIASVSEHQPTTWSSFFFDLHILVFCIPAGLYFLFANLTDGGIFLILYGVTGVYFTGVMVRLMLIFAPIACLLSGVAISDLLDAFSTQAKPSEKTRSATAPPRTMSQTVALGVLMTLTTLLVFYVHHCTWVTSEAYSSPSIVLAAKQHDGSRLIFDDFRESYYWLRMNTPEDARIMSWWDYGYQISAMANRTILVDNNTWNNSHIATVGRAMSANESDAYTVMRMLDVDYVLVWFGGLVGYASDDINKFLWMVRIGGSVFDWIKEPDYYTPQGEFRIDAAGAPKLLNSLMYKMCYYRFGEVMTDYNHPTGFDRVRNVEIGNKNFDLQHIEEVYTTEHWLVRIYKVKKPDNRGAPDDMLASA